jgi:drug/metabolite transporter (DMT)-like permease
MEPSPQTGKTIVKVPRVVWLGLSITIAIDTVVQMVWKSAVLAVPKSAGFTETVHTLAVQQMFYLLLTLFGVQFICWILLLAKADLSYVQPITALSFISVAACSVVFFGEKVGMMRMGGIAMILAGVWLISIANHRTKVAHPPAPCATACQSPEAIP